MKKITGFTYVELMIALGVVAVFGIMAFHAYRDYVQRAYYAEVVKAANDLKDEVAYCFQNLKTFKGCNSNTNSIPAALTKPKGAVASLIVKDGNIIATPVPWDGILSTDTFILTPKAERAEIKWIHTGEGIKHGYAE